MAEYNNNEAVVKWNNEDFSGVWTGEISFSRTTAMVSVNSGANANYEKRNAGLNDWTASFNIRFDDTVATRAATFDRMLTGEKGIFFYAPQGNVSGRPYFEAPAIIGSKEGPATAQDKSVMQMVTITFNADGDVFHELEDGVLP